MSEEREVKRLYQNTAEGSRSVGRPRLGWMDDVREELRKMGVTDWSIRAHRRDNWKMVVKEAKVLQGLSSRSSSRLKDLSHRHNHVYTTLHTHTSLRRSLISFSGVVYVFLRRTKMFFFRRVRKITEKRLLVE